MGKFKGYLICTDCDGTLTDSEGKLSKENSDAIKYFQSEGGLFTLATGRAPDHIKYFENQLKINAPIVSVNGTLLYDTKTDEVIASWPMQKKKCEPVLKYVQKTWPQIWEYWMHIKCNESACYKPMENKPDDGSLKKVMDSCDDEIYKIVFIQPEEITPKLQADLKERFGHIFRFDSSWANGLEMQDINSGKGMAIKYMKEHLGINIHTTVGVGDYENDLSMMENSDISYAVGNAINSVKEAADIVTVTNDESAIAKIISELMEY